MRRWLLLILASAPIVLAACSNFSFNNPIGLPTVVLSSGAPSVSFDATAGTWTLAFSIEARTLPGSPGGTINRFHLASGGQLSAGIRVEACPTTSTSPCTPVTASYVFTDVTLPPKGTYTVVGYDVVGDNGSSMTVSLPLPLQIY